MDRKLLLESLVLLARQPDQGNNLYLAERNIEEFLKPVALTLRSELEWVQESVQERIKRDPSVSKLFGDIQHIIDSVLSRLDDLWEKNRPTDCR